MLSLFLAIAIRAINHPNVKMVITRMCHFFNSISKKVIDIIELAEILFALFEIGKARPSGFVDSDGSQGHYRHSTRELLLRPSDVWMKVR
jgi:hypothetical protein